MGFLWFCWPGWLFGLEFSARCLRELEAVHFIHSGFSCAHLGLNWGFGGVVFSQVTICYIKLSSAIWWRSDPWYIYSDELSFLSFITIIQKRQPKGYPRDHASQNRKQEEESHAKTSKISEVVEHLILLSETKCFDIVEFQFDNQQLFKGRVKFLIVWSNEFGDFITRIFKLFKVIMHNTIVVSLNSWWKRILQSVEERHLLGKVSCLTKIDIAGTHPGCQLRNHRPGLVRQPEIIVLVRWVLPCNRLPWSKSDCWTNIILPQLERVVMIHFCLREKDLSFVINHKTHLLPLGYLIHGPIQVFSVLAISFLSPFRSLWFDFCINRIVDKLLDVRT